MCFKSDSLGIGRSGKLKSIELTHKLIIIEPTCAHIIFLFSFLNNKNVV